MIDKESGRLKNDILETIKDKDIEGCFNDLVEMRNRIIHSFQITEGEEQILATKTKIKDGNKQFHITEEYLLKFIKLNEKLSLLLDNFRK